MTAEEVIAALGLEPLDQEGGAFRQTLRRLPEIDGRLFGPRFPAGPRPQVTAILALIGGERFSALHRLGNDELWLFHMGDPLELLLLHPEGDAETVTLGHDVGGGQRLQHLVPAGTWQGGTSTGPLGWSVVSCVMVPGFAWEDFELGDRAALQALFPAEAARIARLTRGEPARGAL